MTFDLVSWLRRSALPLWGSAGFDEKSAMFVERMDSRGRPIVDMPRRVMVQARQIFVFAEAQMEGWFPGASLAEQAAETMVCTFRGDESGWIFSVASDGRPVDTSRDFYAQAFVLLALASLKRLTGSDRWLELADATLGFLDAHLATRVTGGYAESLPARSGLRRQNPHMHLLEALLALDEASPGRHYRQRAEALMDLLALRFLHGPHPLLVEFYDDDLRPAIAAPFAFEPGHHFEWAWLLARDAALSGRSRLPGLADRLCDVARRFGSARGGVFFDEVDGEGRVVAASTRLWPCAEAIRATALQLGSEPRIVPAANDLVQSMHKLFLSRAADGCWIDHLDADGRPLHSYVPASTLYHLVGAAISLTRPTRA